MDALQGARAAEPNNVIGVDPVEFKRDSAPGRGAHAIAWAHKAVELVRELTAGVMADRVVLTAGIGHADLIPVAMMLTRKGGTCVLTGIPSLNEMSVPLILVDVGSSCKQLKGTLYGRDGGAGRAGHAAVDVSGGRAQTR